MKILASATCKSTINGCEGPCRSPIDPICFKIPQLGLFRMAVAIPTLLHDAGPAFSLVQGVFFSVLFCFILFLLLLFFLLPGWARISCYKGGKIPNGYGSWTIVLHFSHHDFFFPLIKYHLLFVDSSFFFFPF
ncbi:hypothetical protein BJX96DRAFT_25996 [Aspergillus floccosus]